MEISWVGFHTRTQPMAFVCVVSSQSNLHSLKLLLGHTIGSICNVTLSSLKMLHIPKYSPVWIWICQQCWTPRVLVWHSVWKELDDQQPSHSHCSSSSNKHAHVPLISLFSFDFGGEVAITTVFVRVVEVFFLLADSEKFTFECGNVKIKTRSRLSLLSKLTAVAAWVRSNK